jgi:hypothetical protein
MHRRLAELVDYAETQRAALLAAIELVPVPKREERPDPDCWSVAEVLEHLHRVERGIARLAAQGIERARSQGIEPERSEESMLGSLDAFQLARRNPKITTPEAVAPRGSYTATQSMVGLTESRQALLSTLGLADGLALGQITFPHPVFGVLSLYQWVLFVGQHEARHAVQIQEIAGRLARRGRSTRG